MLNISFIAINDDLNEPFWFLEKLLKSFKFIPSSYLILKIGKKSFNTLVSWSNREFITKELFSEMIFFKNNLNHLSETGFEGQLSSKIMS